MRKAAKISFLLVMALVVSPAGYGMTDTYFVNSDDLTCSKGWFDTIHIDYLNEVEPFLAK